MQTPDIAEKTRQAIDRAREVVAQHLRQIAAEAARQLAAANAATQAQLQREQDEKAAAAAAAERAQVQEAERKAETEKHDAEAKALRQIGGLVRKAHGALAAGSSKTAAGLRRGIEDKLAHAPSLPRASRQSASAARREAARAEGLEELFGRAQAHRAHRTDGVADRRDACIPRRSPATSRICRNSGGP